MKPVAWLCQNIDGTYDALSDKGCVECFPVYTAPRQLSDEEILNIAELFWECDAFNEVSFDDIGFARAILKKASEK